MKKGYHRLVLPDGTTTTKPVVVVTDDANRMVSWHYLEGEEAFVEWVGGTCLA